MCVHFMSASIEPSSSHMSSTLKCLLGLSLASQTPAILYHTGEQLYGEMMSLYDGLSVETAPIPEISEKVSAKDDESESSNNLVKLELATL